MSWNENLDYDYDYEYEEEIFEDMSYDELVEANGKLIRENIRLHKELEEEKKKYNDFLDKMVNSTSSVTNEWVKLLVSGDLKISNK